MFQVRSSRQYVKWVDVVVVVVEYHAVGDGKVFVAALMGDIEAEVDAVEFGSESRGELADGGCRCVFGRRKPDKIRLRALLHDSEAFRYDYACRYLGLSSVTGRVSASGQRQSENVE